MGSEMFILVSGEAPLSQLPHNSGSEGFNPQQEGREGDLCKIVPVLFPLICRKKGSRQLHYKNQK